MYIHIYIYIYIHVYVHTHHITSGANRCVYVYIYIYIHTYIHTHIHIYIHTYRYTYNYIYIYIYTCISCISGGAKCATFVNMPVLHPQSSEGKFATSREIEPVRRSLRRRGSRTFTEVARLVPSGLVRSALIISSRNISI